MKTSPAFGQADLTNCERELIHLAGSVQPHGVLLAVREPSFVIVQASANVVGLLGLPPDELLDRPLHGLGGNLDEQVRLIAREDDLDEPARQSIELELAQGSGEGIGLGCIGSFGPCGKDHSKYRVAPSKAYWPDGTAAGRLTRELELYDPEEIGKRLCFRPLNFDTPLCHDKASAKLFANVEARIAWPGKPGAPPPPKIVPLNEAQTALFEKGKTVYATLCAACHQPNGQGLPPAFPALAGSKIVTGPLLSPEGKLIPDSHVDRVFNGKAGTAMQAFKATLSDADLAAIITYERNAFGNNKGDMIQPAQIKALR